MSIWIQEGSCPGKIHICVTWVGVTHPEGVEVDDLLGDQVDEGAGPVVAQMDRHNHALHIQDALRLLHPR